jgi:hypothetical protein
MISYHTQSVSLWHASSKDRPRIDAFVVHGVTIIFVFASGMWERGAPSRFSRRQVWAGDRALKLIPVAFALLCWNTHMHFWLSANTATSEDNNRSGRHQQVRKKQTDLLSCSRGSNILLYGT